mmetsp:Transcript_18289/g.48702  ORF Transcript_18289/g.48702 Transcript_18289/m.48702 type:complete len:276 (+) Transcript_18289:138-965(+)
MLADESGSASSCHPNGLAPRRPGVDALVAELLLDAHELVVLRVAVRPAGGARLDLARAQADGEVRDGRVLGLARAVRAHDAPAALLAHLDRVYGLSNGADLVHLKKQRVACLVVNGLLHPSHIRHGKVIADNLGRSTHLLREPNPGLPIILVKGVLNGNERVVLAQARIEVGERSAGHLEVRRLLRLSIPRAKVVAILALDLELRSGDIHADFADVLIACLLDGLHYEFHALLGVAGRRKAALVAYERRVAAKLFLDDALQGVVALSANLHGLLE